MSGLMWRDNSKYSKYSFVTKFKRFFTSDIFIKGGLIGTYQWMKANFPNNWIISFTAHNGEFNGLLEVTW